MAQILGLCRFARNASGLSKLIPKNQCLFSTCSSGMLLGESKTITLSLRKPSCSLIFSRAMHQYCRKVVPQMPAATLQPVRSMSSGDHAKLWRMERIVAGLFVALFPLMILFPDPKIDVAFASLVVIHAHWGLEAIVVDYLRPVVVGQVVSKAGFVTLYLLSAMTLVGLLQLVYNGPGVGQTIRNFWAIGSQPRKA